MKSLKITLLLAVFALTFSGSSSDSKDFDKQVETYKELKESHIELATDRPRAKKPGQHI